MAPAETVIRVYPNTHARTHAPNVFISRVYTRVRVLGTRSSSCRYTFTVLQHTKEDSSVAFAESSHCFGKNRIRVVQIGIGVGWLVDRGNRSPRTATIATETDLTRLKVSTRSRAFIRFRVQKHVDTAKLARFSFTRRRTTDPAHHARHCPYSEGIVRVRSRALNPLFTASPYQWRARTELEEKKVITFLFFTTTPPIGGRGFVATDGPCNTLVVRAYT